MNTKHLVRLAALLTSLAFSATGIQVQAAEVTINPSSDNTIAQGIDPGDGENFENNSSGACSELFSGVTNDGLLRRVLMQFDIAGNVPAGSTITGVSLSVTVNRSGDNQDATMTLHPASLAWGEGANTCGPRGGGRGEPAVSGAATWLDAEFGLSPWASAGADFGAASASAAVGSGNGSVGTWSSATMVTDVQAWLDNPAGNAGWVVVGDEARISTSRRFNSREGGVPPSLTITFDPPPGSVACCFADGACSVELTQTACTDGGGNPASPATDTCEPNPCPQPVGACCNLDQSCSDAEDRVACESAGGIFQGENSNCGQGGVDCGLTPFVDALPVPPVLAPTSTRGDGVVQYTVSVEAAAQSAHSELPNTDLWTYNGAWPAATIVAQKGVPIEVTYQNNLPNAGNRGGHILDVDECAHGPNYFSDAPRIVTHLHGGHVPARVDGQPEYTILPGENDVYEYPNNQDAATLWYHDHALGITRLNVYSGMAGFYLIADAEDTLDTNNAFGLPSGQYEIGMAFQDREFNDDGSLFYNPTIQDAFKGNVMTVNGKIWPFLNVDQGQYRFRWLNGSQSREYSLRLENISNPDNDPSIWLIGTDLGLVEAPINLGNRIGGTMAPAERFDVVIDFSGMAAGDEIVMRNDDLTTPLLPNVMKFVVANQAGYTGFDAGTPLRTVTPLPATSADATRYFRLEKVDTPCSNDPNRTIGEWHVTSLDGPGGSDIGHKWDDLTEFPLLGTREIWEFENPTNVPHPMHVHLVRFQILDKTDITTGQPIPLEPWEMGTWKDIVRVPPNTRARIIMDFEDYLGRFPQHCHVLDHEDHEMMRQFQTINDPANCVVNGICEPGEDCQSCAADCAQVSGASCGNGLCEAGDGENCATCPEDCGGKQKGSASKQFCCGFDDGQVTNPIGCGVDVADDRCINSADNLFCRTEARLSACCGDALCEGAESISSCAIDCDPNACSPTEPGTELSCNDGNDNDCDGLVDAADPDCQVCVPDETPEQSCFDGNDNDCDTQVDCADTADCEGALGAPTSCGVGVCASTGNASCSGGSEVDSCTPGTPGVEGPAGDATCTDGLDNDCDGLSDANDPDCQGGGVVCEDISSRNACRDEPTCRWKKDACITR